MGGRNRVPMDELRSLAIDLGATAVQSHLQSGNLIFCHSAQDALELACKFEQALAEQQSVEVRCLVWDRDELTAAIRDNPFPEHTGAGSRLLVHFLNQEPTAELRADRDPTNLDPQTIRLGHKVIYQWCPDGVLAAPTVGPFVERHWRIPVTARNWNTVARLQELLATL